MNCLIIDDEPIARKGMKEYVSEVEFLDLVAECENALKATKFLHEQSVDLIFLDIQMPRITGIDFLKTLKDPPLVILTTAYPEFALEGYELDVTDYLVKPISFDRFLKAAQKAHEMYSLKKLSGQPKVNTDHFFIRSEGKFEKIFFDELLFIEGLQNYVTIHTRVKKFIAYMTMSDLESKLPADRFLKVHKSYIISIPHVKTIENNEVIIGDAHIPLSRSLKDEVVSQILGNKLFKRNK